MVRLRTLHLANTSLLERSVGIVIFLSYDGNPPLVNRIQRRLTLLIIDSADKSFFFFLFFLLAFFLLFFSRVLHLLNARLTGLDGMSLIAGEAKKSKSIEF